ncbi:hypothetical protein [Candidatus Palauibacter sp.]|uniref:hypothetical protein n=1 Tax=Candidatus Palauibacter sp. TaxID=3101350 RepID=UPI003B5A6160
MTEIDTLLDEVHKPLEGLQEFEEEESIQKEDLGERLAFTDIVEPLVPTELGATTTRLHRLLKV